VAEGCTVTQARVGVRGRLLDASSSTRKSKYTPIGAEVLHRLAARARRQTITAFEPLILLGFVRGRGKFIEKKRFVDFCGYRRDPFLSFFLSFFGLENPITGLVDPVSFLFCFLLEAATQLARQVHQERTQVVCSNKVDRSRLALRHSRY